MNSTVPPAEQVDVVTVVYPVCLHGASQIYNDPSARVRRLLSVTTEGNPSQLFATVPILTHKLFKP